MTEDKQIIPIPDLVKISDNPEIKEAVLKQVPKKIALLLNPLYYAQKAVDCLEGQLKGVKSKNRRAKLEYKIGYWKKTVEVLMETVDVQKQEVGTEPPQNPEYTFQEVQLSHIKYNLYLIYQALCANIVLMNRSNKDVLDLSTLLSETERVVKTLDPNNK